MSAKLPVDFKELAQGTKAQGAPPYVIRADDLMKNDAYAALQADASWIEPTQVGAHSGRRLKLPAIPTSEETLALSSSGGALGWSPVPEIPTVPTAGTWVLGAIEGTLTWIETEEC